MDDQVTRVKLDQGPYGEMIRAVTPLSAGDTVFYLSGEIVDAPTKYTIQLDETRHVLDLDNLWKSMNHACAPSVRIDVEAREMVVVRDIAAGEELTFNYNTTEWDMSSPFVCGCGASTCAGVIRGFRYLTKAQRDAIRPYVSPYIARREIECRDDGAAGAESGRDPLIVRPEVHVLIPYEVRDGKPGSPDYDTPDFRKEIGAWLSPLGLTWVWTPVTLSNIGATVAALKQRNAEKPVVAFNLCDGSELDGYPGRSVVDALQKAGVPYTGGSLAFYETTTSKIDCKNALLADNVPAARYVVIEDVERDLARAEREIGLPFILKPEISAGSYGISVDSVCYDLDAARRKLAQLKADPYFHASRFFAETFIAGREFTVLVVEDAREPMGLWALPPCERVFDQRVPPKERFLAYERYWDLPEKDRPIPAGEPYYWYALAPADMRGEIADIARRAVRAVGGQSYARVDIRRSDADGRFYVLEVNAQCGLSSDDSSTVGSMLRLSGRKMVEVVERILRHGLNRV